MKWMIASDIHGSEYWCGKLLECYKAENADRLLLLGDILYHGPRNDLPRGYAPKAVISMLNAMKDEIVSVRGNCDTEVDQMVLDFPALADYALLEANGRIIYATHGHIYNEEKRPPMKKGDILLNGHTHVAAVREHENYVYINPGSVSIPKEDTGHGYIILENGKLIRKDIESGQVTAEYVL